MTNLGYPHTEEYLAFLDRALLDVVDPSSLDTVAEICCGRGEAFHLLGDRIGRGVGVDVSVSMLEVARAEHDADRYCLVQGDATRLPLADNGFDSVFMLGGIHHVNGRHALFENIARILKPGGASISASQSATSSCGGGFAPPSSAFHRPWITRPSGPCCM